MSQKEWAVFSMSSVLKGRSVTDSVTEETLGQKIRRRRRAIDMTLQQVSERVGLSIGFLSQIERGASTPSLASLCNIADALGVSVDACKPAASTKRGFAPRPTPVVQPWRCQAHI
jgi:transcriptional regulator with XRE-family HTH domain